MPKTRTDLQRDSFAAYLALDADTNPAGDLVDPYAVATIAASIIRTTAAGSHAERAARRAYRAALDAAMVELPDLIADAAAAGDVDVEAIGRRAAAAGGDQAADVAKLVSLVAQSRAHAQSWRAALTAADAEVDRLTRQSHRLAQTVEQMSGRYAAAVNESDALRREAGRLSGALDRASADLDRARRDAAEREAAADDAGERDRGDGFGNTHRSAVDLQA